MAESGNKQAGRKQSRRQVTTERGEETRARLIEAAHAEFIQRGFHGTSMRQIAQTAGIAVGGIYNHFGSKEAIFGAVLDAYHPYRVILPVLAETQGDSLEAFIQNAARQVEAAIQGAEDKLIPIVFMDLVEFQGRHIRELAEKLYPSLLGLMQRFVEKRDQMRDIPIPVAVRALIALIIGYLLTKMVLRNSQLLTSMDYDWFGGMVDIYLHGIVAHTGAAEA